MSIIDFFVEVTLDDMFFLSLSHTHSLTLTNYFFPLFSWTLSLRDRIPKPLPGNLVAMRFTVTLVTSA